MSALLSRARLWQQARKPVEPKPIEISVRQLHWCLFATALAMLPWLFLLPFEIATLGLAILAWHAHQTRERIKPWPTWFKLLVITLLITLIVARYGNVLGRPAGASLLIGMLALKATESRNPRDGRVLVTVNLFLLMAMFLFEDSLLLMLYALAAATVVFVAMEALEQRAGEQSLLFARLGWRQVLLLLVVSIPLAAVLWLLFPRLAAPLWGTPEQVARTGISDRMSPGEVNDLYVDDRPAMRVRFDGATPPRDQLYFRGPTLWFYDGVTWTPWMSSRVLEARTMESRPDIRYSLYMEPTDRRWLVPLERLASVNISAFATVDLQLLSRNPITSSFSYEASAQLSGPFQPEPYLNAQRRMALQLPDDFNPRARALGQQWQQEFGDNRPAIVERALRMFATEGYSYSLSSPPLGRDRMDDFLFSTKIGFCEHYSSAFVTLMRAAGVPARVATGFLGGLFNRSGQYLTVRNSDAHAWAEVLLDDQWQRVDPTAYVAPDRINMDGGAGLLPQGGFWAGLGQRWDALGQVWREFVLQFNAARQARLLERFGIAETTWQHLALALGILGGLFGALATWLLWRQRISYHRDPWLRGWRLLRDKLKRAGITSAISDAPRSLLQAVEQAAPSLAPSVAPLLTRLENGVYAHSASQEGKRFLKDVRALKLRAAKPKA